VCIQENFAEYDVPYRNDLVSGWNPILRGEFRLPDKPGLGLALNDKICAEHPYRKNSFPSLWDKLWVQEFTKGSTAN
jgi:galactonate dehydratase